MAKIKSRKPTANRKGLPPQIDEASNNLVSTVKEPVQPIVAEVTAPKKVSAPKKDLNFKVNPEFKRRFKTYAAVRGISMMELLTSCFEFYEKEHS